MHIYKIVLGMLLCIPFLSHAMYMTVASTEELRDVVHPTYLNRLRPLKQLELNNDIEDLFMQEFDINPAEIFLHCMVQENVVTLKSIHVQAGKKITRKIILKRLVSIKK